MREVEREEVAGRVVAETRAAAGDERGFAGEGSRDGALGGGAELGVEEDAGWGGGRAEGEGEGLVRGAGGGHGGGGGCLVLFVVVVAVER